MLKIKEAYHKLKSLNYKVMIKDAFYLAAFFFIMSLLSFIDISPHENVKFILGIILLLINIYILTYFFSYIYGREKES